MVGERKDRQKLSNANERSHSIESSSDHEIAAEKSTKVAVERKGRQMLSGANDDDITAEKSMKLGERKEGQKLSDVNKISHSIESSSHKRISAERSTKLGERKERQKLADLNKRSRSSESSSDNEIVAEKSKKLAGERKGRHKHPCLNGIMSFGTRKFDIYMIYMQNSLFWPIFGIFTP